MVSEDDKKFLGQFQAYQQQLQGILLQKENIRLQKMEIESALEELDASGNKKAYKIVGPIMIKSDVTDLKRELSEKKDDLELRTKTLEKAEERITKKLKEMQPRLERMVGK
jgi:prefoldin beta subunit